MNDAYDSAAAVEGDHAMTSSDDMPITVEDEIAMCDSGDASTAEEQGFDFRKPGNPVRRISYELRHPVFIVGFMGAGKTSVARKLARHAGVASKIGRAHV